MKIIALNLNRMMEQRKLEKLFAKYGEVTSCNLVIDPKTKKSKGFGFVEMPNEEEANKAIAALHLSQVSGSKIKVKISNT